MLLYNGSTGLDVAGTAYGYGDFRPISNTVVYKSYRFLMTSKRSVSSLVTYGGVQLFGYSNQSTTSQNSTSSKFVSCVFDYRDFFSAVDTTTRLLVQSGSAQPLWNTVVGGDGSIAVEGANGAGTYYTAQPVTNLFDAKLTSKFTSRGNSSSGINSVAGINTGFHVSIAQCSPTLVQFRFATTDTGIERDPFTITVEGTSSGSLLSGSSWTSIYTGPSGLENITARATYGPYQTIPSPRIFSSYRFLVTSKRGNGTFVSYTEVDLMGY